MFSHKHLPVTGNPSTPGKRALLSFCSVSSLTPVLLVLLLIQIASPAQAQQFRKAIFPHRSVGLFLWDRHVVDASSYPPTTIPNEIAKYNSAHGYSGSNAVSMDKLEPQGPAPMNNWEDWDAVFAGTEWTPDWQNILASDYTIIVVKTGYPATQQMSYGYPWTLSNYQVEWRRIIAAMAARPDKFFVITTNYPAATDGHSQRDQQSNLFCQWAKNTLATGNDSYGPFPPNVYVLDWFHMIASSVDGYCDPSYGSVDIGEGDHPSNSACGVIDPQFVQQIFDAAIAYEGTPLAVTWAGPPMLTGNTRNRVVVEWQTLSEINTYRFYVQKFGQVWNTIDSVNAGGTSLSKRLYVVTDSNVSAGTWMYRIKEVDLNGAVHYSETATTALLSIGTSPVVTAYALEQNYPNPFNPSTTIQYALPSAADVNLTVFNVLGQEAATLVNENKPAGTYSVQFDGSRLASGLYFYRLRAGQYVEMKKLVLLK